MSDATEYLKLKKKLARYSEELTQLKLLESKLSSDLREYLDSTIKGTTNGNGTNNPELWAEIYKTVFKNGKDRTAKFDGAERTKFLDKWNKGKKPAEKVKGKYLMDVMRANHATATGKGQPEWTLGESE